MGTLKVFISSTCYDLSSIRFGLEQFILEAGHIPVLSESSSFPIDPSDDTIENCIKNVGTADILVLILGSRYGYVTQSGKSITEHEYLFARSRGIPIYVFISTSIVDYLRRWKADKGGDFSGVVESTKVFEFVEEVRAKNMDWTFKFELLDEITAALKSQMSFMFKSTLDLRLKYRSRDLPDFADKISVRAINILLDKGRNFEIKFFNQMLKDELQKHEHAKLDLEFGVLPTCERVIKSSEELLGWLEMGFETITVQAQSISALLNQAAVKFYGEPGVPSDLNGLYYVACGIGRVYRAMVDWSLRIRSTSVSSEFELSRKLLSEFSKEPLEQIWSYPEKCSSDIDQALAALDLDPTTSVDVDLVLKLTIDQKKVDLFIAEFDRLKRIYYR